MVLEVCAFNVQSCMVAEKAGAVRVELCDNPLEGGTTPSYGTIRLVRGKIGIELYPIIRPRSLNYFYTEDEWEIIQTDIKICKALGCDGISIGIQKQNGDIDAERMKRVNDIAYPMGVTCNRVFDAVPDPFEALEILIDCGCERILTSGLASTAPEGAVLLKELVNKADNRIIIMPGAGVRSHNLSKLIEDTAATEYHSSARKAVANNVLFENKSISDMGNLYVTDETEIIKMLAILHS